LLAPSKVEGQQRTEPRIAERHAQWALDQVDVGPAIAFHEPRPVSHDRDVPTDDRPVTKRRLRG